MLFTPIREGAAGQIPGFVHHVTTVAGCVPKAEPVRGIGSATTPGTGPDNPEPLVGRDEGLEVLLLPRARVRGQQRHRGEPPRERECDESPRSLGALARTPAPQPQGTRS